MTTAGKADGEVERMIVIGKRTGKESIMEARAAKDIMETSVEREAIKEERVEKVEGEDVEILEEDVVSLMCQFVIPAVADRSPRIYFLIFHENFGSFCKVLFQMKLSLM